MSDEPYKVPKHEIGSRMFQQRSRLYVATLLSLCLGSAISVYMGSRENSIFGIVGAMVLLTVASVVTFTWYAYWRSPRGSVWSLLAALVSGAIAGSLIWMLILQVVGAETVLGFLELD